jgi:hypothetical protein
MGQVVNMKSGGHCGMLQQVAAKHTTKRNLFVVSVAGGPAVKHGTQNHNFAREITFINTNEQITRGLGKLDNV